MFSDVDFRFFSFFLKHSSQDLAHLRIRQKFRNIRVKILEESSRIEIPLNKLKSLEFGIIAVRKVS